MPFACTRRERERGGEGAREIVGRRGRGRERKNNRLIGHPVVHWVHAVLERNPPHHWLQTLPLPTEHSWHTACYKLNYHAKDPDTQAL